MSDGSQKRDNPIAKFCNFDAREAPNCFLRKLAVPSASITTPSPSAMPESSEPFAKHAGTSACGD